MVILSLCSVCAVTVTYWHCRFFSVHLAHRGSSWAAGMHLREEKLIKRFKVRPQRRTFTLRSRHLTHAMDTRFFSGFAMKVEVIAFGVEKNVEFTTGGG